MAASALTERMIANIVYSKGHGVCRLSFSIKQHAIKLCVAENKKSCICSS
jgi:hypothetical protein